MLATVVFLAINAIHALKRVRHPAAVAEVSEWEFFRWPGAAFVLLATTVVALLMPRTAQVIGRGQICQLD